MGDFIRADLLESCERAGPDGMDATERGLQSELGERHCWPV